MATEPVTASSSAYIMTGLIGAIAGPIYGPAVVMFVAATIGGMLALQATKIEPPSKWESTKFLLVAIGLSVSLTGAGVWAVEQFTPLPGTLAIMPVAIFFGAARNKILDTISSLLELVVKVAEKKTSVGAGQ